MLYLIVYIVKSIQKPVNVTLHKEEEEKS